MTAALALLGTSSFVTVMPVGAVELHKQSGERQSSGIVTCITGTGYLVCTCPEAVRTSTYSVQTGTENLS